MRWDLLEGVRTLQWSGLHSGITDTLSGPAKGGEFDIVDAEAGAEGRRRPAWRQPS